MVTHNRFGIGRPTERKAELNLLQIYPSIQIETDFQEAIELKRKTISLILFVLAFIAAYLIMCFGIPGLRIKLEAEPAEYFLASIRHMALFKSIVSLIVGIIIGVLPLLIGKKKQ